MSIYNANCEKIVVENPTPMKIWNLPNIRQVIQPYEFGEPYKKRTCLWLKGVKPLNPTNIVEPMSRWVSCGNKRKDNNAVCKNGNYNGKKKRAKTFPGVAKAMATQWTQENTEQTIFDMV